MLHFLVVAESMRLLLLNEIDYLQFVGLLMKIRVHQMYMVLHVEYVVEYFIGQVFCKTSQFVPLFDFDPLNLHLMVAPRMKTGAPRIKFNFHRPENFHREVIDKMQPAI